MSELGEIYDTLSEKHEIYVMPVRMIEEKMRIPSDDVDHAIMVVDYFLEKKPLMLFAPRQIMEAWFYAADENPGTDKPLEVHVPGDLISEHGGIPILRMKFITEDEYAELVSEIQNGQVRKYTTQ